MHLESDFNMEDQGGKYCEGNSTMNVTKTKTVPTESESLRINKRPLQPPDPRGVKRREVVQQEASQAVEYFDLTEDGDSQPLLKKTRRAEPLGYDTAAFLTQDSASPRTTPRLRMGSPGQGDLVSYALSSTRSPEKHETDNIQRKNSQAKKSDDFYKFGEESPEASQTSEFQPKLKYVPFVNEGYRSFLIQQGKRNNKEVSEAELAATLISSDNLRNSENGRNATRNDVSSSRSFDTATKHAIALKEKIERDGAEKSRALRDATKRQNDPNTVQQSANAKPEVANHAPQRTARQIDILSTFSRTVGNGRPISDYPASVHSSSGGTSTEPSTDNDNDYGSHYGWGSGNLLSGSRDLTPTVEHPPRTQQPARFDVAKTQQNPPKITSLNNEDAGDYTSKDYREKQLFPSKRHTQDFIKIENLDANTQRFEAYTRLNERQKAGPTALFTPRHALDGLDRSYQPTKTSLPSPFKYPKFFSPYGESIRRPYNLPQSFNQSSDESQGPGTELSRQYALLRAPNQNGGLAMLARKAGVDNHGSANNLLSSSISAIEDDEVERKYVPTTFSESEFRADYSFSIFKRHITQKERDMITRHEWLKQRQRALMALQETFLEAAKLACITGVTEPMEKELPIVEEFKKLVLEEGKMDPSKRRRLLAIKTTMTRRRRNKEVEHDRLESQLDILINRKDRQRMVEELKKIEKEVNFLGDERFRESNKSLTRKKRVGVVSPDADGESAKPQSRKTTGPVIKPVEEPKVVQPKLSGAEKRKIKADAFEASQRQKKDALLDQLNKFDQPTAQTTDATTDDTDIVMGATEEDAQSAVSEEDAGHEMYANTGVSLTRPVLAVALAAKAISSEEMQRLDDEREEQGTFPRPRPVPKPVSNGPTSSQAPDAALAAKMRITHLGIPEQNDGIEALSDGDEDTSADSDSSTAQLVNNYVVYGRYTGVEELEDYAKYRLGRFLKKENADTLIGAKVVEFCNARERDVAAAEAADDTAWLAQLGDPEAGTLKHDMKSKEQVVELPASSCRIWMEVERVQARSRAEKEVVVPSNIYVALFKRTMADGSIDTPSWDELVTCTGENGVWLANREAVNIMGAWYGERMLAGDAAMKRAALEEEVEGLGEGVLFRGKEEFVLAEGVEEMEVWVEGKKNRA